MSQTVEFELAKILEDIRQDIKETNRKLDKVIESQVRQEEQIKALQKGQDDLTYANRWLIGLVVTIIGSIVLRALNILPKI